MLSNQIKLKLHLVHLLGGGEVFAGLETPFFLHFDLLHQVLSDQVSVDVDVDWYQID